MEIFKTISNISKIVSKIKSVFDSNTEEDIKEYKQQVTNSEFNDKLNNSKDIELCDAIRKEKQKKIEELKI